MLQQNLDTLLDHVAEQVALLNPRRRPASWSDAEDEFIRKNLGWMTDAEMGQALGRSAIAVHLRWDRDLELPGPSKAPNVITAHLAAKLLGIDGHKTAYWVDCGLIPGRVMAGGRNIRLIDRTTFRRWVLNPMHWVYFNPKKVRDPELRHMLELRAARWGDEWWSTVRVARYHGVETGDVKRLIADERLPSFRLPVSLGGRDLNRKWSNHFVLKSEALKVTFRKGRGNHLPCKFTPAADAWLLKARDELGFTFVHIGRTMKIGKEKKNHKTGTSMNNPTISYRYHWLKARAAKTLAHARSAGERRR
jgi:hypothetical protein